MDINARQIESQDFNYLNQAETYQYSADQLERVKSSAAVGAQQRIAHNSPQWLSAPGTPAASPSDGASPATPDRAFIRRKPDSKF